MLTLPEWSQLVGLQGRNPFAYKQADEEQEWLEACFVEHPAYDAMVREVDPRSSILHAARGAGKTTTCTMFERLCREEANHRRPLVVRLHEWIPLVDLIDQPLQIQVNGYLEALFGQITYALAATCNEPWLHPPEDPSLRHFLAWFCTKYAARLTDDELTHLVHTSRLLREPTPLAVAPPTRLHNQSPLQQLRWLVRALRAANVKTIYVLVDRVDEVAVTVAHPERGADLLLPLLGNLELLELEGLVFKCFIPTSIVTVLRERGQLREDRVRCYDLTWADARGPELLRKLLQNRLSHFSGGSVQSLAPLADSSLRDIDDQISAAAVGSPRQLLVLSENLLLTRANDATGDDLLIQRRHLAAVIGADNAPPARLHPQTAPTGAPKAIQAGAVSSDDTAKPGLDAAPDSQRDGSGDDPQHDPEGVPWLTLGTDGRIARGGASIEGWQQLPSRQRDVMQHLFSRVGVLCHYKELGRVIWKDSRISDDTVRKVVDRLQAFLQKGYDGPPYIEKITGGYYVLRHAIPITDPPPSQQTADDMASE